MKRSLMLTAALAVTFAACSKKTETKESTTVIDTAATPVAAPAPEAAAPVTTDTFIPRPAACGPTTTAY